MSGCFPSCCRSPAISCSGSPAYRELNEAHESGAVRPQDRLGSAGQTQGQAACNDLRFALNAESRPCLIDMQRQELAELGPIHVELRGLFSGSVNRGRLYLRAYPESRKGENVFRQHSAQPGLPRDRSLCGRPLQPDGRSRCRGGGGARLPDRPLVGSARSCSSTVDHLWLMGACDDLVLDSAIAETVSLV